MPFHRSTDFGMKFFFHRAMFKIADKEPFDSARVAFANLQVDLWVFFARVSYQNKVSFRVTF